MEEIGDYLKRYIEGISLLLERIGAHPRIDKDEEFAEMLRRAGWRPFRIEKLK